MRTKFVLPSASSRLAAALCCALACLATAPGAEGAAANSGPGATPAAFDYVASVGTARVKGDAGLCLNINNGAVPKGARVVIVWPAGRQSFCTATVGAPIPLDTEGEPNTDGGEDNYRLVLESGRVRADEIGIAVLGARGAPAVRGGKVSCDVDGDKKPENFRACTSTEGMHLTVWSGAPLTGERVWHNYVYLGYDVEPSCKEPDFKEDVE